MISVAEVGTFIAAALLFGLAFAVLALGVLMGRAPIAGSCGGLNRIPGIDRQCGCDKPCPKRQALLARMQNAPGVSSDDPETRR
jgi:hypothetical protein